MSLPLLKKQIDRLLATETPEVMAIKGAWGVGKTFAWNKFVSEASRTGNIGLDYYSYVSLFGLNSLDDLKLAIFMETVHKKHIGIEKGKGPETFAYKKMIRRAVELFRGLPYAKDFWPSIQAISFYSLRKAIVCIDDFERKGKALDAQDVMGLVSFLRENRQCKVVLILNEQSLEDNSLIDYKKYREKVIDLEMLFNPTSTECVEIALPRGNIYELLKDHIERLGINNIRMIKKIEALSRIINPLLEGLEQEVAQQAYQSLVLFTWCFYSKDKSVPEYEFVKRFGYGLLGLGGDEKNESEERKGWKATLRQYGYQTTNEFDLQIAKVVQQGYVDEEDFRREAMKLNQQCIATKSQDSFTRAWDAYHDTFADNEEILVKGLWDTFKKNVKYIGPVDLDGTVRLFRELGKDKLAEEMISYYLEERKEDVGSFLSSHYPFRDRIKDKMVIEEFSIVRDSKKEIRTVKDVLLKIAGKNGWGGNDEEVLSKASVEEYYSLFKSEEGPHLSSWIDTCLQFGRFENASERLKCIASKATEALRMIGKESVLNSLRVTKFGIEIDNREGKPKA